MLLLATFLGVSGPSLAAPCSGPAGTTCWWLGSNYNWFSTTGTELKTSIRLPTTSPKSTDQYFILLSAVDNANSYDQVGFWIASASIFFLWSWTDCSGSTINYHAQAAGNPPFAFTSAEIYTFRMYFANQRIYFAVYDSTGAQVGISEYSDPNPNGITPTNFVIAPSRTICGNNGLDYTDYLEQLVSNNVPDMTWTFEDYKWLSGGTWTQTYLWQAFGSAGSEYVPNDAYSAVAGLGDTMVQNWHDFTQCTTTQHDQFGCLLDKGSDGWGANGYGWHVGLYNGHNWIYEAKTQGSGSPPSWCPSPAPPSCWQEPQFAGGPGSAYTWYAYSSTNPAIMYVNSLSKWILAYTDARNNRVATILSYDADFYKLYGWDPNSLRQLQYGAGNYITSTASVGLIFAGGSSGGIYLSLIDSNQHVEVWKSTDGLSWTRTNAAITNPVSGVVETAQRGVSAAACCGEDFFAWESTQTPGQIIVYALGLDGSTVYNYWYTGETSQDRPTLHQAWGYIYLAWPGTDASHFLNVERYNYPKDRWEYKITMGQFSSYTSYYQVGEAIFGPGDYCGSNCVAWVLVWKDPYLNAFNSIGTRMSYK